MAVDRRRRHPEPNALAVDRRRHRPRAAALVVDRRRHSRPRAAALAVDRRRRRRRAERPRCGALPSPFPRLCSHALVHQPRTLIVMHQHLRTPSSAQVPPWWICAGAHEGKIDGCTFTSNRVPTQWRLYSYASRRMNVVKNEGVLRGS